MILIALGYKQGVGKDYLADYLEKEHFFTRVSFANKLKDAACTIFGWERHQLENRAFKEAVDPQWGISPRRALQLMGSQAMREAFGREAARDGARPFAEDAQCIWVNALEQTIQILFEHHPTIALCVTDLRHKNEFDMCKKYGQVARVDRNVGDVQRLHSSDTELASLPDDQWDLILDNEGDKALRQLDAYVESIFNKNGITR